LFSVLLQPKGKPSENFFPIIFRLVGKSFNKAEVFLFSNLIPSVEFSIQIVLIKGSFEPFESLSDNMCFGSLIVFPPKKKTNTLSMNFPWTCATTQPLSSLAIAFDDGPTTVPVRGKRIIKATLVARIRSVISQRSSKAVEILRPTRIII
jgi:hypothetical protein